MVFDYDDDDNNDDNKNGECYLEWNWLQKPDRTLLLILDGKKKKKATEKRSFLPWKNKNKMEQNKKYLSSHFFVHTTKSLLSVDQLGYAIVHLNLLRVCFPTSAGEVVVKEPHPLAEQRSACHAILVLNSYNINSQSLLICEKTRNSNNWAIKWEYLYIIHKAERMVGNVNLQMSARFAL